MDCKLIVDLIDKKESNLSKNILKDRPSFCVAFANRKANNAAHTLARKSVTFPNPFISHCISPCIAIIAMEMI